ncbi:hypothetical protein [Clostridium sp. CF012]|nr:hypothetical protein [Clostridium sp. CF012]MBU3143777.1 hypothetical protein [Clostridium sp. CF012]
MITGAGIAQSVVPKTAYNKMLQSALTGGLFFIAMCKFMVYNLYIG